VYFERHGEMRARPDEAFDPKFSIALYTEKLNLNGMDKSMEQRALGQSLVEGDDVDEGDGIHVGEFRRIETEGTNVSEEFRSRYAGAFQFDGPNEVEKFVRKVRPHQGLHLASERKCDGEIVIALLLEIGCEPIGGLSDFLQSWLVGRFVFFSSRNLLFDGGVKLVQGGRGLCGLAEDIAAAKAGEIVGRIVEAKLMNGAGGTEQLHLSVLKLGIHLQDRNAFFGILIRIHSGVLTPHHTAGCRDMIRGPKLHTYTTLIAPSQQLKRFN